MKLLLSLFLFLPVLLFAQSGTDEDGLYFSSGPVYNGDRLTGYFTLQIGKVDEEILKYTIKLLDLNADQIGKTVYQRKNSFALQRIVYNGTYLALQLKEGDNPPYVDVLDGAGERIRRQTFEQPHNLYLSTLWPVADGFIYATSYEMAPDKKQGQRKWTMGFLPNEEDVAGWEISSENPERTSHYLELLDATSDVLLFGTNNFNESKKKTVRRVGLMGIDVGTGATLFTNNLGDQIGGNVAYESASILEGGITAVQTSDLTNDKMFTIRNFTPDGNQLSRHDFFLSGKVLDLKGADKALRREYKNSVWIENGHVFTPDGQLQIGVETARQTGSDILFQGAFSVTLDSSGQRTQFLKVDRPAFTLPSKFLGLPSVLPVLSRKGRDMMSDIQFHNGPLSFAGQQVTEDLTIQYYFDREFTKEGVRYTSIHAIYYLDGELKEEVIPFESDADMVRIYPGKEGYFLVMEAYGDGSIKKRLERMDF